MDDLDIYGDLDNFDTQVNLDQVNSELQEYKERCESLTRVLDLEQKKNLKLEEQLETIKHNFNSLLQTSRAELARKDAQIIELRKERDNIAFRRNVARGKGQTTTTHVDINEIPQRPVETVAIATADFIPLKPSVTDKTGPSKSSVQERPRTEARTNNKRERERSPERSKRSNRNCRESPPPRERRDRDRVRNRSRDRSRDRERSSRRSRSRDRGSGRPRNRDERKRERSREDNWRSQRGRVDETTQSSSKSKSSSTSSSSQPVAKRPRTDSKEKDVAEKTKVPETPEIEIKVEVEENVSQVSPPPPPPLSVVDIPTKTSPPSVPEQPPTPPEQLPVPDDQQSTKSPPPPSISPPLPPTPTPVVTTQPPPPPPKETPSRVPEERGLNSKAEKKPKSFMTSFSGSLERSEKEGLFIQINTERAVTNPDAQSTLVEKTTNETVEPSKEPEMTKADQELLQATASIVDSEETPVKLPPPVTAIPPPPTPPPPPQENSHSSLDPLNNNTNVPNVHPHLNLEAQDHLPMMVVPKPRETENCPPTRQSGGSKSEAPSTPTTIPAIPKMKTLAAVKYPLPKEPEKAKPEEKRKSGLTVENLDKFNKDMERNKLEYLQEEIRRVGGPEIANDPQLVRSFESEFEKRRQREVKRSQGREIVKEKELGSSVAQSDKNEEIIANKENDEERKVEKEENVSMENPPEEKITSSPVLEKSVVMGHLMYNVSQDDDGAPVMMVSRLKKKKKRKTIEQA